MGIRCSFMAAVPGGIQVRGRNVRIRLWVSVSSLVWLLALGVIPVQAGELRVLVSGFEPFGGLDSNPSQEVVLALEEQAGELLPQGVVLKGVVLPVTYAGAWPVLSRAMDDFRPDMVLCLGVAAGSPEIRLETLARNMDLGYADNQGLSHRGPIVENGPAALATGLPLERLAEDLDRAGFSWRYSDDAGGYLCNTVFYRLMHAVRERPEVMAGFVHLPMARVQGQGGLVQAVATMLGSMEESVFRAAVVEFEPEPGMAEANLVRMGSLVRQLKDQGADMVLFPEMAFMGLAHRSLQEMEEHNPLLLHGGGREELGDMARDNQVYLGAGMAVFEDDIPYNAYVLWDPQGRVVLRYLKNHLYGDDFNWAEPGRGEYPVVDLPMGRVGMLICHDVVYAESFEPYARQGVDLLLIGTNWIGQTPMESYLLPWSEDIPVMLVSDRRGQEQGMVFQGNTQVLIHGRQLRPGLDLPEGRAVFVTLPVL